MTKNLKLRDNLFELHLVFFYGGQILMCKTGCKNKLRLFHLNHVYIWDPAFGFKSG